MSTMGRMVDRQKIIEAVEHMLRASGVDKEKPVHKKMLEDSIFSMIVMANMMGFSRNDVIFALKDEWLRMKQLKEAGNDQG